MTTVFLRKLLLFKDYHHHLHLDSSSADDEPWTLEAIQKKPLRGRISK
jgi:hypothetical protein